MWDQEDGRVLTPPGIASRYAPVLSSDGPRVLHLTAYDPGSAVYRYHSSANTAIGGRSVFARWGHENPYCDLRQFDVESQCAHVVRLCVSADVIHVHMDYKMLDKLFYTPRSDQLLVRHYHGSHVTAEEVAAASRIENAEDDRRNAMQVGARLYHHRFSPRMNWLPIPVPVQDYANLPEKHWTPVSERTNKCVRIAHSPTNARIKGTTALQYAVADLVLKGLKVELIMIEGKSHAEALAIKASCDITFDSFWLGIQGSGLEAAAMGQAVVAGDPDVKAEYEHVLGECPYTYAKDFDTVKPVLERLVVDEEWRRHEAARVRAYVNMRHDYPAVGARYWELIGREQETRTKTAAA